MKLSQKYLERLSNPNRNVYLDGSRVKRIDKEISFKGAINNIVKYYDLQEAHPNIFCDKDLGTHISYKIPVTKEGLIKKRRAYKIISELSYGMLGRTPDFMAAALAAIASNADFLGKEVFCDFEQNAINYYKYCKNNNLFVGHAAINPQIDRSKQIGNQENIFAGIKVVDSDNEGIIVTGAKMIVTLAHIADELLVFNMPGLRDGDDEYAVAFALDLNMEGVKMICRKPMEYNNYSTLDYPFSNAFDEMDAYLVLENVRIPWDRVLIFKDIKKSNQFYDKTAARHHTGHQGIVRGLSKLETVTSVAAELAEKMGLLGFMNIQEKLGKLTTYLDLTKAAISFSEDNSIDHGVIVTPDISVIQALRYNFPKWYQEGVELIQSLAAGSMLAVPSFKDIDSEDNAEMLNKALTGPELSPKSRCFLLNIAWDLSGTSFGQRQVVYEKYHAGDPMRIAAFHFRDYDKSDLKKNIKKMGVYDIG